MSEECKKRGLRANGKVETLLASLLLDDALTGGMTWGDHQMSEANSESSELLDFGMVHSFLTSITKESLGILLGNEDAPYTQNFCKLFGLLPHLKDEELLSLSFDDGAKRLKSASYLRDALAKDGVFDEDGDIDIQANSCLHKPSYAHSLNSPTLANPGASSPSSYHTWSPCC